MRGWLWESKFLKKKIINCGVFEGKIDIFRLFSDPHEITPNGKILAQLVEIQNLMVVNWSNNCRGLITRRRQAKDEESVIDLVIISNDLNDNLESLESDENR